MSHPVSRLSHPFDIAHRPSLEPEVISAILTRWGCDRSVAGKPGRSKHRTARHPVPIDDSFAELRTLDSEKRSGEVARQ